jgi:hypothetical protein
MAPRGDSVDFNSVVGQIAAASCPDELLLRHLGPGPLIVGTIHASKGREADAVTLVTVDRDASTAATAEADAEEARVLYVGLSRARESLDVRKSGKFVCGYADGRAWHATRSGVQIEVGRDGDIDPSWPMRLRRGGAASAIQQRLQQFDGGPVKVHIFSSKEDGWTRLIRPDNEECFIGALSLQCRNALDEIARARLGQFANFLAHLWWIDVGTAAYRGDDGGSDGVPPPWGTTRTWLTPVVVGLGLVPARR